MRRFRILPITAIALAAVSAAAVVAGDKETPDDSMPRIAAVVIKAEKNKPSADLVALVAKVRRTCEHEDVLFVDVDVSTRGTRHQGKLLLNVLGLNPIWKAHAKKAGRLVLVEINSGEIIKMLSASDGESAIKAAIAEALEPVGEPEDDPEEEDGDENMK
ncbi:MAG: hypothetical protein ACYTGN_02610 [Planctomycetota bacterium]|jgi:hypothetical protein